MTVLKSSTIECARCNDTEWIRNPETGDFSVCPCQNMKQVRRLLEISGISEAFRAKTVNDYRPANELQRLARAAASQYILEFDAIRKTRNNSICFLGQPGAGKTHLSIAIANALMKRNIGVRYVQYREVMTELMQVRFDEADYRRKIAPLKSCSVLLLDDLFKGAVRRDGSIGQEGTIMFEVINHRYLAGMPMLVSSEYTVERLVEFDEAVATRIAEMAKGRITEFRGKELNYRMTSA